MTGTPESVSALSGMSLLADVNEGLGSFTGSGRRPAGGAAASAPRPAAPLDLLLLARTTVRNRREDRRPPAARPVAPSASFDARLPVVRPGR